MMTEIGASVAIALNQANEAMRLKIKEEVFRIIKQKGPETISLEASAILITAVKQG